MAGKSFQLNKFPQLYDGEIDRVHYSIWTSTKVQATWHYADLHINSANYCEHNQHLVLKKAFKPFV